MRFVIHSEICELFPGVKIAVATAMGVDQSGTEDEVGAMLGQAWTGPAAAASAYPNAQSHPRVRPWRERLRAAGAPPRDFPSSVEALLRRTLKGADPFRINPLVDFYNAISLRHVVPAGGFDLDRVSGDLELRLTTRGDTFHALDADREERVSEGEVCYACGQTVLTRHFVWRQAKDALITATTRDVMLLAEVLGEVDGDLAETVSEDLRDGLAGIFGAAEVRAGVVDATRPSISW